MTKADARRFRSLYHRLCFAFQHLRDANEYKAYAQVLAPLEIDAVERAALEVARQGSWYVVGGARHSRGFPKAAELYVAALPYHQQILRHRAVEARPRVELTDREKARDLKRIAKARAAVVKKCRRLGFEGLATMIEAVPMRHPADDPCAPVCETCSDRGHVVVLESDGVERVQRCACFDANPVIHARAQMPAVGDGPEPVPVLRQATTEALERI